MLLIQYKLVMAVSAIELDAELNKWGQKGFKVTGYQLGDLDMHYALMERENPDSAVETHYPRLEAQIKELETDNDWLRGRNIELEKNVSELEEEVSEFVRRQAQ